MKRRLQGVLAILLVGVVVNLATAWPCVTWGPPGPAVLQGMTTGRPYLAQPVDAYKICRRAGWPCRSVEGVWLVKLDKIDRPLPSDSALSVTGSPLRVLWPGFVLNSLVYVAIAALPLVGWVMLLRPRVRAARHRCPECGYPVGDSTMCTECGQRLDEPPTP